MTRPLSKHVYYILIIIGRYVASVGEVHEFDLLLDFLGDDFVDALAVVDVLLLALVAAVLRECLADLLRDVVSALADGEVIEGVGGALHDLVVDRRGGLGEQTVQLRDGDGGKL